VRILLAQNGVGPDRPGNGSRTPLLGASLNGHEGVVGLLLAGDDVLPHKLDKDG